MTLGRRPPKAVLTALREEVHFRCPVPMEDGICGSPYLSWHHFDPPWRVENHHRVEGMIALCTDHAAKADGGVYTDEQLRRFKQEAAANDAPVEGDLAWRRQELVLFAGTGLFVNSHVIVAYDGIPHIWFERNEHGEMLLNYKSLRSNRTIIENNLWVIPQDELAEVVCPPRGRKLEIRHLNGDVLKLEFKSYDSADSFLTEVPGHRHNKTRLEKLAYPLTVLFLTEVTTNGEINIHPDRLDLNGNTFWYPWFKDAEVAINLRGPAATERFDAAQQAAIAQALYDYNHR
ncbi:hypothetical protein AB0O14_18650 [Microbacterium foliorum]